MKKHPTPILLLLCTILLIGGTAVAYCNTRSFGFEPDAKWITYNDGGFTVYDFRVEYRQLAEGWQSFSNFFQRKVKPVFMIKWNFDWCARRIPCAFSLLYIMYINNKGFEKRSAECERT